MKRNTLIMLFILALLVSYCGKGGKTPGPEIAEPMLAAINNCPIGVTIKAEPGSITVADGEDGRYLITIKKPELTFDTGVYNTLNLGVTLKSVKLPVPIEQITYLYGPEEKYLGFVSLKGMDFKWDAGQMLEPPAVKNQTTPFHMNIAVSAGEMTCDNYNISFILQKWETADLPAILARFLKDNQALVSTIKDLSYGVEFPTSEKKIAQLQMRFQEMSVRQKNFSEAFASIYDQAAPLPDIHKLLEQGASLIDFEMDCTGMEVKALEDGKELGGGSIASSVASYFLNPDDAKKAFNYGFNWKMKDLKVSVPGKDMVGKLAAVKELDMKMAVENLSPQLVQTYFDVMKKGMAIKQETDPEKLKQQQAMVGMQFISAIAASQPAFKMSLDPLNHEFGQLSAGADFKIRGGQPPVGKAVVNALKVQSILDNMKAAGVVPEKEWEKFSKGLLDMLVIDDQGNGALTFELKADQPGKFFLNGKAIGK